MENVKHGKACWLHPDFFSVITLCFDWVFAFCLTSPSINGGMYVLDMNNLLTTEVFTVSAVAWLGFIYN
jgi:hypothetical protein